MFCILCLLSFVTIYILRLSVVAKEIMRHLLFKYSAKKAFPLSLCQTALEQDIEITLLVLQLKKGLYFVSGDIDGYIRKFGVQ